MNPESEDLGNDWKLKLRYGRLKTPYSHFTVIAGGRVIAEQAEFDCPIGNAFMGMKVWATNVDEAADMIFPIGAKLSFEVTGKIEVFDTEPKQPPRDLPYGYDINFTPFRDEDRERQPNQALQTTSVTRSGFGKVSVFDRHRRGV